MKTHTSKTIIALLYLSALLQGLTLVSFPALSSLLKDLHGFSDAEYGSIFLPQVVMAILGSVSGATLVKRFGLKTLLLLALLFNILSQAVLGSSAWIPHVMVLPWILLGTSLLGLGFGLGGAPLNTFPSLFFPVKKDTAVGMVHTFLGIGLAAGPIMVAVLMSHGNWLGYPFGLVATCLIVLILILPQTFPQEQTEKTAVSKVEVAHHPAGTWAFWVYALIAVVYSFAEGTFSNWAVIYLGDEKHFAASVAASALSVFWAAMAGGRFLISVLVLKIPAETIWRLLPVLILMTFLLLPYANTPTVGISLFALAGLSCAGFFPLTVGIVSRRYNAYVPFVSAMMMASLMAGVGLGSFVIGPLHQVFSLETLYRLSTIYPGVVLCLIGIITIVQNRSTKTLPVKGVA